MAIQDEFPKSRLTLTYRTTIDSETQEVTLPFRILVLADFSLGSSRDRKVDLAERELRPLGGRKLDPIMKDMKMSVRTTVPNRVDGRPGDAMSIDIPIDSISSFSPDQVAQNVPKLRALLILKQLLLEMQAIIDNRKDVRKMIQELYTRPELGQALLKKLPEFQHVKIPDPNAATGNETSDLI